MQDRFEDLRTFVAVVQARSFAAAARQLGVVTSAVSRRMQDLENRLGTRLLNRTTRSISLTETGRDFYDRAIALLAGLEEAEGRAAGAAAEPVGTLRLTGPTSFGNLHLAPVICSFLELHPRLAIELSLDDHFADLVAGGFDLAVRVGDLPDSSLAARRLAAIRRVACASPAYLQRFGTPRVPADLTSHRGIAYANVGDRQFWRFTHPDHAGETVVNVNSRLRLNTGEALREAALAGCGVTVLPAFIIHKEVARGELVPLLLPWEKPSTSLHAVYPSRRNVPVKVRAFVDYMAERFARQPYWDRAVFGTQPV